MIRFDPLQLDALSRARRREMRNRIASRLLSRHREALARHGVDAEDLPTLLDAALDRAAALGFVYERDLRVFAECCAEAGFDFPNLPAFTGLADAIEATEGSAEKARVADEAMTLAAAMVPDAPR